MLNVDTSLVIAAIAGVTTAAALTLFIASWKSKRRTKELLLANKAMATYYKLVDEIIDDPALPNEAAEFLAVLTNVLPSKQECSSFTSQMASLSNGSKSNGAQSDGARMFELIEGLGKSRPDLRDNFHAAISNGVIALFHRWSGDSWKFMQMTQEFTTDPEREFQIVYKIRNNHEASLKSNHAVA